jgi:hypothetical protein
MTTDFGELWGLETTLGGDDFGDGPQGDCQINPEMT